MSEKTKIKLDDIACDCIDTATPDVETSFPCGLCGESIGWRKSMDAFHFNKKHWHSFCLLEYLINLYEQSND